MSGDVQSASGLMIGLSALAAAVPVIAYVATIWWLDRYEREPLGLVALTFLYGAVGGVLFGVIGSLALVEALEVGDVFSQAAVVAPLAEEPAKALILFALLLSRQFDNTTDGLVYGAATGLGFAMTENFLYFVNTLGAGGGVEAWAQLVIMRGLFTALMHSAASATFGAVLGYYRYRRRLERWLLGPLLGLGLAVLIHGVFNGALVASVSRGGDPDVALVAYGLVPVAGLVLFAITQLTLLREHHMIRRELRDEAAAGLIEPQHAAIIPYYRRRRQAGWLPLGLDRASYVRAVTLLAFRKDQARRAAAPPALQADVERLRREIQAMRQWAAALAASGAAERPAGPLQG